MMSTMRKYRVIISGEKKHTRHVRARDFDDAVRQSEALVRVLEPTIVAALGLVTFEIVEMGRVSCRTRTV